MKIKIYEKLIKEKEIDIKDCPFCGELPNVFQVTDNRYKDYPNLSWVIECKDMGCIFKRSNPNKSLDGLLKQWNKRF